MTDVIISDEPVTVLEIDESGTVLVIEEQQSVMLAESEQGPAGLPGAAIGFEQSFAASLQWLVNHNLGHRPVTGLFLNGVEELDTQVLHTSINQCIAYFSEPTAGTIRCV